MSINKKMEKNNDDTPTLHNKKKPTIEACNRYKSQRHC